MAKRFQDFYAWYSTRCFQGHLGTVSMCHTQIISVALYQHTLMRELESSDYLGCYNQIFCKFYENCFDSGDKLNYFSVFNRF